MCKWLKVTLDYWLREGPWQVESEWQPATGKSGEDHFNQVTHLLHQLLNETGTTLLQLSKIHHFFQHSHYPTQLDLLNCESITPVK